MTLHPAILRPRTLAMRAATTLVATAVTASLASPASAQAGREQLGVGSETKKAEKKESLFDGAGDLLKKAQKKPEGTKPRDPNAVVKGGFDYEKLEMLSGTSARQLQLMTKKMRTINKLLARTRDLIERSGPNQRNAVLFYRMAEYTWELNHIKYLIAMSEFQKKLEAFESGRGEKPVEPVENVSESIYWYKRILQQFPNYKELPEVLYKLGKSLLKQGKALQDRVQQNEGVKYLQDLVQRFPDDRRIPRTHLALAEHFFDTNNLTLAKMNYEKIVQNYASSPLYNYAQYKLGWVYFNLQEVRRTIDTFQDVVRGIGKSKNRDDRGQIEFRDQALKDLILAFAELDDGWREAESYYTKVEGEDKMWGRLLKLANLYVAQDKDELAIALFGHFIDKKPTDKRCLDWHEQIIDARLRLGKFSEVEDAIRAFLAFTDDRTSSWIAANRGDKPLMEKTDAMGEKLLLFMSNQFHQAAQKKEFEEKSLEGAKPLYAKAAKDYKEFVRRYPNSKKAYIVNFYYAEILYDQLKDYDAARVQYKRVIELQDTGAYVEDAALGVIYSTQELMKQTRARYDYAKNEWIADPTAEPLLADAGEGVNYEKTKTSDDEELTEEEIKSAQVPKKRQNLHPLEQDFVGAADRYVDLMFKLKEKKGEKYMKKKKKGRDVPGIMYLAAATYYDRGQYPKSIARLEKTYEYDKSRGEAEIAVKTLIDIYARLKEWPKIEEWSRKMLARGKRKLKLFKVKDLKKYIAVSVGEQARELAEKKRFDEAHEKYDTILREFRRDYPEMAALALYNKAAIYEIQKDEKRAIETYERVAKEFKKSKVAPEALFNIGMIYEAQTQFKEAADAFLTMTKFRDNADAAQALINAGQILIALRRYDEAAKAFEKFIKLASSLKGKEGDDARLRELVPDAHFEIAKTWDRQDDKKGNKNASKWYGKTRKFKDRGDLVLQSLGREIDLLVQADEGKKRPKNQRSVLKLVEAAKKVWEEDPKSHTAKASLAYARALFAEAEYTFDAFDKVTLKDVKRMKGLKPTLTKKAELLKASEKMYFAVIDATAAGAGRAYAAAAAFRVGLLYFKFKEDLFNAPIPRAIEGNYDLEDAYRDSIDKFAAPIEEQSLVALRNAISVAHNLGVYNEWSKLAGEYAAKVNPTEYPTVDKDPNLPKAQETVRPNKMTDTASSAAFIFRVRRGKYTVDYKPDTSVTAAEKK